MGTVLRGEECVGFLKGNRSEKVRDPESQTESDFIERKTKMKHHLSPDQCAFMSTQSPMAYTNTTKGSI